MQSRIRLLLLTSVVMTSSTPACADLGLSLDFNFYPHLIRLSNDTDFTLNASARLPGSFSYFSFMNLGGVFHSGPARFTVSEQNMRWTPSERLPIDLVLQDIIRRGGDNDTLQFGPRWRVSQAGPWADFFKSLHVNYSVQFFFRRWDQRPNGGWQISHAYQLSFPYLSDRLYLSGFIDHNLDEERPGLDRHPIISENQVGLRLYGGLYVVAEYRLNEYRTADKSNFALGVEIKSLW